MISTQAILGSAAVLGAAAICAEAALIRLTFPSLNISNIDLVISGLSDVIVQRNINPDYTSISETLFKTIANKRFRIIYDTCTTLQAIASAVLGMTFFRILGVSKKWQAVVLIVSLFAALDLKARRHLSTIEENTIQLMAREIAVTPRRRTAMLANGVLAAFAYYKYA